MSNLWFVESGPDGSHLFDVAYFGTLRDAKNFAENLPMTPIGTKRPYRIKKHEYIGYKRFSNTVHATQVTPNA